MSNMILSNKNLFKYSLIAIISIEIMSFLSFKYPAIAPYVFGLVMLAVLAATIKNLEWGVCVAFVELIIGSFGKILVLPVHGFQLPIRMVIFGMVVVVWLIAAIKKRRVEFLHSQFFKPYLILAAVLGWGIVWGILRRNGLGTVFFDVNNYFYFLLVFPVYDVWLHRRDMPWHVSTVITVSIAWLSIKTIALFYIFSHEFFGLQDVLYAWSRKMQLAEITNINPAALTSRIFIQSQIWILFGLFIALGYLLSLRAKRSNLTITSLGLLRFAIAPLAMTVIMSTALIMSFSRSFWLAGLLSLFLLCAILLFILREKFSKVFSFGFASAGIIVVAVLLTLGVAGFPIPRGTSSIDLLKNRASQFGDNAASSRLAQVRPLLSAIAHHPVFGFGFGTAVTYQSQDPRVLKTHPDGWYTTTAFELGWLEMWLKIGLLGVGAYLYLLWMIFKAGWKKAKDNYLVLGGLIGLVALVVTHGLSPYLNHPLGIGIILLMTSLVNKDA